MIPKSVHSSSGGNPPLQTGKLSPPHSSEGIPSAHDKSPTHTRPLSLLPPTAAFTHRECLRVCAYVSWTATFNTQHCPQTERNHRERQWERQDLGGKKEDKRSDGAPEHACVKQLCHECDEVIDGKVLCAKGHHLLLTSSFCQLLHHPNSQGSSLFISKKTYSVLLNRSRQRPAS